MKLRNLLAVLTAAAVLAGCAGADTSATTEQTFDNNRTPDTSAELTVAQFSGAQLFDPHKLYLAKYSDPTYISPVYDQLLRLDGNLDIQPMLATDWAVSPDGRSMTMDLQEGVTFHDGSQFDAATVVANFERARDLPGSTASPLLQTMTALTSDGPNRITITFSDPNFTFPYTLASSYNLSSMISPRAIAEGRNLDREPAGSGPFTLTSFGQDRTVFERVENYWDTDATPQLAKVTVVAIPDDNARLNALRSGQIQLAPFRPNQSAAYKDLASSNDFRTLPFSGQIFGLVVNTKTPGLDDPRVRKAISMAVDRNAINAALFDGQAQPAFQLYPESMDGYVARLDTDPYDPDGAKELLAEAGHPQLTLDVVLTSTEPADSIATILQAQLAEVGITLNLQKHAPTSARVDFLTGAYDAFAVALNLGGDPSVAVTDFILGADNVGGSPESLTRLADAALAIPLDSPDRAESFEAITQYLVDEPLHLLGVRVPIQYIGTAEVMNVGQMGFSHLGSMIDFRPLAVAETS